MQSVSEIVGKSVAVLEDRVAQLKEVSLVGAFGVLDYGS